MFRLIEAFALSGLRDAHLVIVGNDKTRARAEQLARSRDVASRVHFAGTQADVRPWYGAADALVLATLYDPFPNAALEAMACGLPVVTTRQCGTAEIIDEGVNGFVGKIAITGSGELALGCGAQKPRRLVVEYFPKPNATAAPSSAASGSHACTPATPSTVSTSSITKAAWS